MAATAHQPVMANMPRDSLTTKMASDTPMANITSANTTHDYGGIRVTMTSSYSWQWNDKKSGASRNCDVYHAQAQGDLRPLGSIGFGSYQYVDGGGINGKRATLLVGNVPGAPGRPAVAAPERYDLIWKDEKSKGSYNGSFWRPVAPSGYVSLGDVCVGNWSQPNTNMIWCVRDDLTQIASYQNGSFWDDRKSGAKDNCSLWDIRVPSIGTNGAEKLPMLAETFRANNHHDNKPSDGLARVLVLPLPKEFTDFNTPVPRFTKDNIPHGGDVFNLTLQCQVTLPFIVFFGTTDAECLRNISNPFSRLTRHMAWYVEKRHLNDAAGTATDEVTWTKGVSTTQGQEMTTTTGVSISAGFGIKGFGMDMSLNHQTSSTTSSSYTEYEEGSYKQGYTVPPYEAIVFLIRRIWIEASRSNGSVVLKKIDFNANRDMTMAGVSLK